MLPGVLTAPIRHGPSPSVNRPSRCDKVRQGATVSRQFGDTVASYELRIARSSMEESLEESSAFVPFVSFVCFVHMRLTCGFSFVCFVSFVRICLKTEFQVQLIEVPSYGRHFCHQGEVTLLIACVSRVSNQGRVGCQTIDDI